jgi:glycosyltransferase involved in cell wall biosynthesis
VTGDPAVSVIVPARNAEATLSRTLDALAVQSLGDPFEVIVVDNGSADRTASIAEEHPIGATVLRNEPGHGPGYARNRGALEARGPVLAFTDSDCFPTADWLERGLQAMAAADLMQGRVDPDPRASRGPFDRTVVVTGESGFYETANLFVRRSLFDEIGGFEDWVVAGGDGLFGWRLPRDGRAVRPAKRPIGEDVLFGWRARRLGARTGFADSALVHHQVLAMSALTAIRDRWIWRHLPALPSRIPELRSQAFYRRFFFYRRSAVFDLAFAGLVAAGLSRRWTPLIAVLPYAEHLRRDGVAWREHGAGRVIVVKAGTDAMSFVALVAGSVGWRAILV